MSAAMQRPASDAAPGPIAVTRDGPVMTVAFNRPDRANALDMAGWHALRDAMRLADEEAATRVVILAGAGKHFTAGIDLSLLAAVRRFGEAACPARGRDDLRRFILDLQDVVSSIERCRKPVIARITGACVGGGIDIATACDLRYCSDDAFFSVKEVDLGLAADVGTLQRLPKLIGEARARELCYTARRVSAAEAAAIGLVNASYPDPGALSAAVDGIAQVIAAKSPLAIRGTKEMITYVRDRPVADALNYVATWNASALLGADLEEAMAAAGAKRPAMFPD